MNPTANWSLIPEHLRSSVEGYIEHREHPGGLRLTICSVRPNLPIKPTESAWRILPIFSDCMRLNAVDRKQILRLGLSAQGLVKNGNC
jgi:hypothetical protein